MNPQPTIFISSIISEFNDLRGALKYFLNKSGFRVLMSEEPDFNADCRKDSLDNCKSLIEQCDYYLLIIGNNSGTEFKIDGQNTSVTLEEFKHFLTLKKHGKSINFFAFVRQQTWEYYKEKNPKINQLQISLIEELVENSLLTDKKIGRWRYTFNKFHDIISVLETNQNGLFLDSSKKTSIYKKYIKTEVIEMLGNLIEKGNSGEIPKAITEHLDFPSLNQLDYLKRSKIDKINAIHIHSFIIAISSKSFLSRKIDRIYNYIALGEFSFFNPNIEEYEMPEYIKTLFQTLEILERIFGDLSIIKETQDYSKNIDFENYFLNKLEYNSIKNIYDNLKVVISKLSNLVMLFHNNWNDFEKMPNDFYSYGKRRGFGIENDDVILFAKNYFDKRKFNN